jgi:hypothetical protein
VRQLATRTATTSTHPSEVAGNAAKRRKKK